MNVTVRRVEDAFGSTHRPLPTPPAFPEAARERGYPGPFSVAV